MPLRPKTRTFASIMASIVLHSVAVVRLNCGFDVDLEMPEFELELTEMEMLDPDQVLGDQPEPEPEPEVLATPPPTPETPAEPEVDPEAPAEPEAEPEPEPEKPKFGDKTSKIDKLGPANSSFFILLATRKIAKLKFASQVVDLVAPLPDFEFIIEGGGFHVLRDFNFILIASPDLRWVSQTFLAVEYRLDREELKAGLERAAARDGQAITWEEGDDGITKGEPKPTDPERKDWDPRIFILLESKVALYVRPEFVDQILTGPDDSKGKTTGNYVANLSRLRRFAAREPRAGLQLSFKDLHSALKKPKRPPPFPIPDDLEIMAEAANEPELVAKFEFLDQVAAKEFELKWTEALPKIIDTKVPFIARGLLRGIYSGIEIERSRKNVSLRNRFSETQATMLLDLMGDLAAKMLKRDPKKMEERRKERDELWKARKKGKLTPSEAYQKLEEAKQPAGAEQPGVDTSASPEAPSVGKSGVTPLPKKPAPGPPQPAKSPPGDTQPLPQNPPPT